MDGERKTNSVKEVRRGDERGRQTRAYRAALLPYISFK